MQDLNNTSESVEFEVKPRSPRLPGRALGLAVLGLAAVALVTVILVAVIGTASSSGDPLARVMPSNVMLYFSMTTHPDRQPNYSVVADAWRENRIAEQIESSLESAVTLAGFDWEKDIATWLGDRAAVGVVDVGGPEPAPDPSSEGFGSYRYRTPFVVVAVQTRDRARSDAFLASFRSQRESTLSSNSAIFDEVYRGVSIVYVTNQAEYMPPYGEAYATIDDVVVVAFGGRDDLKKVIDAALDGTHLESTGNFQATMGALPDSSVAVGYMDAARYMDVIMTSLNGFSTSIHPAVIEGDDDAEYQQLMEEARRQQEERLALWREMIQAYGGMGLAMTYQPDGIRFDMSMQLFADRLPDWLRESYQAALAPAPNRIFDAVPSSAVVAASANNLAGAYSYMLDNPDVLNLMFSGSLYSWPYLGYGDADVAARLAEFEQQVGVDLSADLLDLFNGELAFVVLPSGEASGASGRRLPFEVAALLDATDANLAVNNLTRLLEGIGQYIGGTPFTIQPLSGLPYTALAMPDGTPVLVYGIVDGRLVIGSNSETLLAIDNAEQSPLPSDAAFKAAMAGLPASRIASGYVQLEPFWGVFQASSFSNICDVCEYLRPFSWLSYGSESFDVSSTLARGTVLLGLEPAE
jgi:hypothetical protein